MLLFLLIFIISFIVQLFLPWWIIIPIVFACCGIKASSGKSAFLISFLAIFTLWLGMSLFFSFKNDHILASRVGVMLGLNPASYNWIMVALISTLPGAITAGFAGISGYLLKKIFSNN
jgi:hypothetical protein